MPPVDQRKIALDCGEARFTALADDSAIPKTPLPYPLMLETRRAGGVCQPFESGDGSPQSKALVRNHPRFSGDRF
jgi:hypothetical protein